MHQGAKTMLMAQYSCRVKFATLSWKTILMKFAYTFFIYTYNIHVCVVTCVYVIITHQHGNKPSIIVDALRSLRPLNEGVHNIAQMVEFVNICQPTNPSQSGLLHPGTGESKASTSSSSMSVLLITEDHFTRPRIYR